MPLSLYQIQLINWFLSLFRLKSLQDNFKLMRYLNIKFFKDELIMLII